MARTVFSGANVLDGHGPARPDTTVVVDGDRIVDVAAGVVSARPGDVQIDLAGRTLMPAARA